MAKTALNRTTFRTSREMDFFSEKELVTQTGHGVLEWPQVIVKELVDNAMDACEEAGIAPDATVTADPTGITVVDNGPGLPADTLAGAMDFRVRCSNREMYIEPDRGAQGNSLKTLLTTPYVVDPDCGRLIVITGGTRHEIVCKADQVSQTPVIQDVTSNGQITTGTSIKVQWSEKRDSAGDPRWPFKGMDPTYNDWPLERFLRLVRGYSLLNPHLSLKVEWFGHAAAETTGPVADRHILRETDVWIANTAKFKRQHTVESRHDWGRWRICAMRAPTSMGADDGGQRCRLL